MLRASLGKAFRFPTVTELYQTESTNTTTRISDPNLKPEKIFAKDLTAEGAVAAGGGVLRLSLFEVGKSFAMPSTALPDYSLVTRNQNIDKLVRTRCGSRLCGSGRCGSRSDRQPDLGIATPAPTRCWKNHLNPASVGKWVVRVPDWRASLRGLSVQ